VRIVLGNRPFQGAGASLYVGGPAAADIRYRRFKCEQPSALWYVVSDDQTLDPGAAEVPKCLAVAQVSSPTNEITYTISAELLDQALACQVRTFADDRENESIYRPRVIVTDSGGDDAGSILGVVTVDRSEKRDGGTVRIYFTYRAVRSGTAVQQFRVVQTAGPGTIADVVVTAYGSAQYSADVEGMADGDSCTFRIDGEAGAAVTTLATGIVLVADAAGPPAVTGATAIPY